MELEDAIKLADEMAEEKEKLRDIYISSGDEKTGKELYGADVKNVRMISSWLKELKAFKEDRHSCQYCIYGDDSEGEQPCNTCKHNYTDNFIWKGDSDT